MTNYIDKIKQLQAWIKKNTIITNVDINEGKSQSTGLRCVILIGDKRLNEKVTQMTDIDLIIRLMDGEDSFERTEKIMHNIQNNLYQERRHDILLGEMVRPDEVNDLSNNEFALDLECTMYARTGFA